MDQPHNASTGAYSTPSADLSPPDPQPDASVLPAYVPPTVTTYTDAQLLAALGPAQAGSGMSMFQMP